MIRHKLVLSTLLMLLLCAPAWAVDNGTASPYSRFGLGRLAPRTTGFNAGMGGVGIGMQNGKEVNTLNPASYAFIDSLTFLFDAGASLHVNSYEQPSVGTSAQARATSTTASLDYVTMGFQAAKGLGVSVGVLPFSHVGYEITTRELIDNQYAGGSSLSATNSNVGNGGLHEVYLGAGWCPVRYVSVGASVGYLWGDIKHSMTAQLTESSMGSSYRLYDASIRSYTFEAGLQLYAPINLRNRMVFGATYSLGHKINDRSSMSEGSNVSLVRNTFEVPHTFGAGLSWEHRGRLRLAADYQLQKWDGCRLPWPEVTVGEGEGGEAVPQVQYATRTDCYRDSHRIAAGLEFCPLKKGAHWREYIRYRVGFAVTTPYVKLLDARDNLTQKGPTSYLATAGVSIPVMVFGGRSNVNLSAQYERVQPALSTQLRENYVHLCVGITFNEQWFAKWRVN